MSFKSNQETLITYCSDCPFYLKRIFSTRCQLDDELKMDSTDPNPDGNIFPKIPKGCSLKTNGAEIITKVNNQVVNVQSFKINYIRKYNLKRIKQ